MPLISLWDSTPDTVSEFTIEQVVATAGDGNLRDDTLCSRELREYLAQVDSEKLSEYVERCLGSSFAKSGMVLQDLVNELGRRLDYKVVNGRYQGTPKSIGFDGMWTTTDGSSIVVEVKTTDAYRISLDTIAGYRNRLIDEQKITASSSILLVVGRGDTGDLEAQVRGSRHAWDIRLISTDALIKLVSIKESAEGIETGQKIRSLLTPMEYTRLDPMIEVMFAATKDVEAASDLPAGDEVAQSIPVGAEASTRSLTERSQIQGKRDIILTEIGKRQRTNLIRRTAALYWSADHSLRVACTISKRYARGYPYWYAYHPSWDGFLSEGAESYLVLGCMDLTVAFVIPRSTITPVLQYMSVTEEKEDSKMYWHLNVVESAAGAYELHLPKRKENLPLDAYQVRLQN